MTTNDAIKKLRDLGLEVEHPRLLGSDAPDESVMYIRGEALEVSLPVGTAEADEAWSQYASDAFLDNYHRVLTQKPNDTPPLPPEE